MLPVPHVGPLPKKPGVLRSRERQGRFDGVLAAELETAEFALFDEFLAARADPVTKSGDYGLYRLK